MSSIRRELPPDDTFLNHHRDAYKKFAQLVYDCVNGKCIYNRNRYGIVTRHRDYTSIHSEIDGPFQISDIFQDVYIDIILCVYVRDDVKLTVTYNETVLYDSDDSKNDIDNLLYQCRNMPPRDDISRCRTYNDIVYTEDCVFKDGIKYNKVVPVSPGIPILDNGVFDTLSFVTHPYSEVFIRYLSFDDQEFVFNEFDNEFIGYSESPSLKNKLILIEHENSEEDTMISLV